MTGLSSDSWAESMTVAQVTTGCWFQCGRWWQRYSVWQCPVCGPGKGKLTELELQMLLYVRGS